MTTRLSNEGKIATRPVRGGVTLYLPEDAPESRGGKSALDKILKEDESEQDSTPPKHKNPKGDKSEEELIILGPAKEEKE